MTSDKTYNLLWHILSKKTCCKEGFKIFYAKSCTGTPNISVVNLSQLLNMPLKKNMQKTGLARGQKCANLGSVQNVCIVMSVGGR